jgi:hypothetical protein
MTTTPGTKEAAETIRQILIAARAGQSSVAEIGAAHDLAVKVGLPGCTEELRQQLLARLQRPGKWGRWTLGKDLAISIAAGVCTHFLLKDLVG